MSVVELKPIQSALQHARVESNLIVPPSIDDMNLLTCSPTLAQNQLEYNTLRFSRLLILSVAFLHLLVSSTILQTRQRRVRFPHVIWNGSLPHQR